VAFGDATAEVRHGDFHLRTDRGFDGQFAAQMSEGTAVAEDYIAESSTTATNFVRRIIGGVAFRW